MTELREKIRNHERLFGTHLTTRDPHWAEVMGTAGFDYYWIDMEHTELTADAVYNILTAARAAAKPPACFVRVAENNPVLVKPILEMGPDGIIFPLIKTADDARKAVASCTYPPRGIRGFCPRRIIDFGLGDMGEYLKTVDERIWKLIQIETKEAFDNLDEILEVGGVDVFVIGPCDLSAAFGHLMEFDNPVVKNAITDVIEKVHRAGKPVGVSIGAYDCATLKMWMDRGVDLISAGGEIMYAFDGAHRTIRNMREAAESADRK